VLLNEVLVRFNSGHTICVPSLGVKTAPWEEYLSGGGDPPFWM
jgi:hypothetical protein